MGRLTDYEFTSVWRVDATPAEAFEVLQRLDAYPAWWPEVKEAHRIDRNAYELRCRSLLPYDLRFTTTRATEDAEQGILEASLSGDLEGFSRWTITDGGSTAICTFEERVITNKRLLNVLAPIARPAFMINHSLMMRNGLRGLATFMAGFKLAESSRHGRPG